MTSLQRQQWSTLTNPLCKHCKFASTVLLSYDQFQKIVSTQELNELCSGLNSNYVKSRIKNALITIAYDADIKFRAIAFGKVVGNSACIDVICSNGCGACVTDHFINLVKQQYNNVQHTYIMEPINIDKLTSTSTGDLIK